MSHFLERRREQSIRTGKKKEELARQAPSSVPASGEGSLEARTLSFLERRRNKRMPAGINPAAVLLSGPSSVEARALLGMRPEPQPTADREPATLPTPTREGAHREVERLEGEIDEVKSRIGKVQPYAMRDAALAATPYAAGLQARQAAEEQASPRAQLTDQLSRLTAARTKAKNTLFDLNQQAAAENYERTATAEDAAKGLKVETQGLDLTGAAREAAARVLALQVGTPGEYGIYPQLNYLTQRQRDTLLSLAGRNDWQGAGAYWKAIERSLNAQNQKTQSREVKAFAKEHPVAGAAVNVGAGFTQGLAYGANAVQAVKNAVTGEYEPTDPNSGWFLGTHVAQDTAEGIHAAAEKAGGGLGAFAADTALSVANMGTKMLAGPAALPLMGLSAAGDNTLDALERGATPGQALATSTAAGAAEILTEKLPVDEIFRLAKTAPKSAKEVVKNILKTMGSEGLQEAATEISNNLVDQMVMGDRSQYELYVRELMADGADEASARKAASRQFYLANVGMAALGGAAAGGFMGGISQGVGYAWNRGQDTYLRKGKYRAIRPQNVDMPTVPIINLSVKDIPGVEGALPKTGEALRRDAINRARSRLGIEEDGAAYIPVSNVRRDGSEYVLKITRPSLNKMLYPAAGAALPVESIVVMDNLERIANNGVYFKSEGDRDARQQIPGWDHLMTTVYIDGEPYSVDMRVKLVEEKPGRGVNNVLYYYSPEEIVRIKKVGADTPTSGRHASSLHSEIAPTKVDSKAPTVERRALNMNSELGPTSGPIIPSPGDGVKPEYAQDEALDIAIRDLTDGSTASGRTASAIPVDPETAAILEQAAETAAAAQDVQADTTNALKQDKVAAKYAPVAGENSGLDKTDYAYVTQTWGQKMADRLNAVAKLLGTRVRFVDSVRGGDANAQIRGSEVLVEKNNPNPVMFLLGHEWLHRMQDLAPEQYRAFRDFVSREVQGEARVLLEQYRAKGENIDYEGALDEAAANYAGRMIADSKVLDDFIQRHREDRTLLEKVRDAIRSLISKLTGEERRQAQTAEGKLTAALEAATKQAKTLEGQKNTAREGGEARYSRKYDPETASVKEQIANSQERLANMSAVATVRVPEHFTKKSDAVKWATELLAKTGYAVEKQGYGKITFSPKDINHAMNYADTDAEMAAIAALPSVLKRGIEIGRHNDHKGRKKSTVTFAAPVVLNGTRGNMAVVVNQNGDHYYAHRIVMPDGSAFVFTTEKSDAAQEPSRGVAVSSSLADTTSATSTDSIFEPGRNVKRRLSLKTDSTGRDLSLEQAAETAVAAQDAQAVQADAKTSVDTGTTAGYNGATQQTMEEERDYESGSAEIHLRDGGQRSDGADPGGQVRRLEGGTGQDQGRTVQAGPKDAGTAALTYGRKVTTASLGIGGGSDTDGIRLVTGGDTEATGAAKAIAKERGLRLVLFAGSNLTIRKGRKTASVRAYISGDRVFVRADHPEYTAEQLMRHEAGHDRIAKGEIVPRTVRERISKELGAGKLKQLAGLYEEAYRGTGLTADEVWEEVICDSLGDMNIFSGTIREEAAGRLLEPTKRAAGAERTVNQTRGPPQGDIQYIQKGELKDGRTESGGRGAHAEIGRGSQEIGTDGGREGTSKGQGLRGVHGDDAGRRGRVDPSFGKKPVHSWAEGHIVEPASGSVAYAEQQTAMEYGVPSFVVTDEAWVKNRGVKSAPAFARQGQIFFRESLPEEKNGKYALHELTHVMEQVGFRPYLEFIERTPTMLNMSDPVTGVFLEKVAAHIGATLGKVNTTRLYDEVNATVYGGITSQAGIELFTTGIGAHIFNDFEAYAEELAAIHEQFKKENGREVP